ncbi:MAG: hypothetical protein GKR86_00160 [Ilumatobacter sp.]|nr:hypothetical protein [Ilumatobacter sp.]
MVTKKIEELEQLPISQLPDNWSLAVKLAWQDNTNTTNITSETLNLNLSESEKVKQTQASQASQLGLLSQDVQLQGQEVAAAKNDAAKALQASITNKTDIGSNSTAISILQKEINTVPTDGKLQKEVQANASDIIKLKNEIQNLPTDAKLEQEVQTNKTDIATNATDIATNATDIATNKADIATNKADIATNKTDIAANATDIADNLTAIKQLQEDVKNGLGVDYIVEQKREADGRWYQKYASGYIVQGGKTLSVKGVQYHTTDYLIPFTDVDSLVFVAVTTNAKALGWVSAGPADAPKRLTAIEMAVRNPSGSIYTNAALVLRWQVTGY